MKYFTVKNTVFYTSLWLHTCRVVLLLMASYRAI